MKTKYNTTIIQRKLKVGYLKSKEIEEYIDSLFIPSDNETALKDFLIELSKEKEEVHPWTVVRTAAAIEAEQKLIELYGEDYEN